MLGRKDYTKQELADGRAAIDAQLAAYKKLVKVMPNGTTDKKAQSALHDFEWRFCNSMVLALDRPFVHRIRPVTGKDANPLNEVELICDSLITNDGVFRGNNVLKYVADESVVKLKVGDQIRLSANDFERLAAAFFDDLERKFVS